MVVSRVALLVVGSVVATVASKDVMWVARKAVVMVLG